MNLRYPRWLDPYGLLVFLVGVLVLLEAFLRHVPERVEAVMPFIPESTSRRALFVIGILLLYLSEQIARRKRAAWVVTTALLVILVLVTLTHHFSWLLLLSYVTSLVFFISERRTFVVRSDTTSLRRGLTRAVVQIAVAFVVVGVIFAVLDQREFGRHLTSGQTLHFTLNALFGKPLPATLGPTRYDDALIDMLRYTIIIALLLLIWNLFRPLRLSGTASRANRMLARRSLERYGSDSEDFFKLYPRDKHYFFYGEGFVPYAVRNGTALVLDGICSPPDTGQRLRRAFLEYCHLNGWLVAIIHANGTEAAGWQKLGLDTMQIGSEATINSHSFVTETMRSKHFRYVRNRATKEGLHVEFWQPPLTDAQLGQLKKVSDAWIANGRQEYTFIMAPFSRTYLRGCQVAVLKDASGTVSAYANILPPFAGVTTASIDHMRSLPGTSSVTMHFLLAASIEHTESAGFTHFNLGFVPLAKLDTGSTKVTNRLLATFRRVGARFYSSEGLEQFKGKFEPEWTPRFLVYDGGVRRLPVVATALRQVITYKSSLRQRVLNWPVTLMAISSLLYASFPFAVFLNPKYAWHGLTSALGGDGQPYAWFFNVGDIVSSVIAIGVLGWLYKTKRPRSGQIRWALSFALLAVLGAFIAAVITMPDNKATLNGQLSLKLLEYPEIIAHGFASVINSGAFVVAAILWAIHWHGSKRWLNWRTVLAVSIVLTSTVGFVLGQLVPGWAGTIQRAFIVMYGAWFVIFTHDLLKLHRSQRAET